MFEPVFEHDVAARGAVRGEGKLRGPRLGRVLAGRFPRLARAVRSVAAPARVGKVTTVRLFSDEVHVRSAQAGGDDPVQFIWRGKLYVVHEVLSRWRERSAWWEHAAVAAVHGDTTDSDDPRGRGPVLEIGDLEREVFRVEASIGHSGGAGVYDLARPVAPGTSAVSEGGGTSSSEASEDWQLLRVSD